MEQIIIMAQNNGFPEHIIHRFRNRSNKAYTGHPTTKQKNASSLCATALLCVRSTVYSNEPILRQPSALPTQYYNSFHKNLTIPTIVEYISLNVIRAIGLI